jgi:hypothetical protein
VDLPPLDDIDDDGLPFAQSGEAGSFKGGYVDEYVLPPPSRGMKPNPFATLNHFTVPVSSTAVSKMARPMSRPGNWIAVVLGRQCCYRRSALR